MKRRRLHKGILFALLGISVFCGTLFGGLFAILHSPSLLSRIARTFGFDVSAQTISISPNFSGSISGLSVKSLRDDGVTLVATKVTAKNSLDMVLRGQIASLVLQNPKLTFRIDKNREGTS